MSREAKICEAKIAIEQGADELDMVIHLGALQSGDDAYVIKDINGVKGIMGNRLLKVIIESSILQPPDIRRACELVIEAGADFVKTSTGFGNGGARLEDVKLIKEVVGDRIKIKASGGISNRASALGFIAAGASRIGTSSAPLFVQSN
jgi:deoxyribose-phosphate aldolase